MKPMKYILFLLMSLSVIACNQGPSADDNANSKPENLLPKEKFIELYYDAELVEAAVRVEIGKGAKAEEISKVFYENLFQKYHITEKDFSENIRYYASDPEQMSEIQTIVVNRLTKKESELTNQ